MFEIINIVLTSLPYLGLGWAFAKDPSLDGFLYWQRQAGDSETQAFVKSLFLGHALMAILLLVLMFTGIALLFGASGKGVLIGVTGGVLIAVFGPGRL